MYGNITLLARRPPARIAPGVSALTPASAARLRAAAAANAP